MMTYDDRYPSLADFPERVILVPTDDDVPVEALDDVLLVASRPLHGRPVDDVPGVVGFVVIAGTERTYTMGENLALDAHRIVFVTEADALTEVRAQLAVEYPEVDLDEVGDLALLDTWRLNRRP